MMRKFFILLIFYMACDQRAFMSPGQWLLFDFDGTLVDTLSLAIEYYNESALQLGCKQIRTEDDVILFRDNSISKIIMGSIPWRKLLSVPLWLPAMISGSTDFFEKNCNKIKPFLRVKELLQVLSSEYKLAIITAGSTKVVQQTLARYELENFFEGIYSDGFSLISGKEVTINRFLVDHNLNSDDVVFIGDEVDDVNACRKAGVKVISVTWGYNSKEFLGQSKPDYIVDSIQELFAAVPLAFM